MKACDVMTPKVVTVPVDTPVPDIATVLLERRISAVAVVDNGGRAVGVVSEGDLIRRPELGTDRPRSRWLRFLLAPDDAAHDFVKTHGLRARDVMSGPAVGVSPDAPLADIVDVMGRRRIKRVFVLEDGKPVGIVTRTDLLRALHAREVLPVAPVSPDDQAIREAILRTLREEDWAVGAIVNVQVAEGKVHLWGAVDSDEQRRAIRLAVDRVPGVRAVEEHLSRLRPG
jgi:CBS domain-containing protein